jgi:hypothetical protein
VIFIMAILGFIYVRRNRSLRNQEKEVDDKQRLPHQGGGDSSLLEVSGDSRIPLEVSGDSRVPLEVSGDSRFPQELTGSVPEHRL